MDEYTYFEQFVGDVDDGLIGDAFLRFGAALSLALKENPDLLGALQDLERQGLWKPAD